MIVVLGLVLAGAGLLPLFDVGGAGSFVIRRVTSRDLGQLAPGFAATRAGFRVYAGLVVAIGLMVLGLGISPAAPVVGMVVAAVGVAGFVAGSVVAIVGEVQVYRSLPARRR